MSYLLESLVQIDLSLLYRKESSLDEEVAASGYTSEMQKRWEKANRNDNEETDEEEDDEALEAFEEESDREEEETTTRNESEEITHLDAWMRHLRVPEGTTGNANDGNESAQLTEEPPRGAVMRKRRARTSLSCRERHDGRTVDSRINNTAGGSTRAGATADQVNLFFITLVHIDRSCAERSKQRRHRSRKSKARRQQCDEDARITSKQYTNTMDGMTTKIRVIRAAYNEKPACFEHFLAHLCVH